MRIVLIGAGNLASNLGKALPNGDRKIVQVFSRTEDHARQLSTTLGCVYTTELSTVTKDADLYIIAVKDFAIEEILEKVDFQDHLVIHTSGSVPISVFENHCMNYGVFYPMQTFSKDSDLSFRNIPILIEANNSKNLVNLENLALAVSEKVLTVNSAARLHFHLSAVFANNFVNHCYFIAEQLLKDQNLDFSLLKPLILETASKATKRSPDEVQTGPARRMDKKIIDKHLQLLSAFPEWERIYRLLSENIYNTYKNQNDVL